MRECPRCESCYGDEVLVCPEDQTNTKFALPGPALLAGRYQLEKRLGRGAMGQVYLARDQNLAVRRVAVKTVRPDILSSEEMQEGEAIARFEREAKTAASIRHPNVVDVTDFGKSPEGVFYLVMEYVQGETMHQLLRREGTLSVQRALGLLRQVVAGVEAAHDEGILHRDLKPANIFIMQSRKKGGATAASSGDGFIKVGDFGLAKIVNQAVAELDAVSGSGPASRGIIGTPEYMAPEQMQPGAQLDARADVYALGVIAYHMLGGRPPFTGDLTQLIMQKLMNAPPPLTTIRSDISPEVERAVMHALEKDPNARSASVSEWLDELEKAASKSEEPDDKGEASVVVLAPSGAEVYVDDERHGSVGRSGRIILNSIAPGRHVLRVARAGDQDDERVIEIRPDASEQIIQAQMRPAMSGGQTPASRSGIGSGPGTSIPGVVMCAQCSSRFASGVKFCGRCGGSIFVPVNPEPNVPQQQPGGSYQAPPNSGPNVGPQNMRPTNVNQPNYNPTNYNQPNYNQPNANPTNVRPPNYAPPGAGPASNPASGPGSSGGTIIGMRCPRCATNYPPTTKFCGRCGVPTVAMTPPAQGSVYGYQAPLPGTQTPSPPPSAEVVCQRCATRYPPNTRFCGRCGNVMRP